MVRIHLMQPPQPRSQGCSRCPIKVTIHLLQPRQPRSQGRSRCPIMLTIHLLQPPQPRSQGCSRCPTMVTIPLLQPLQPRSHGRNRCPIMLTILLSQPSNPRSCNRSCCCHHRLRQKRESNTARHVPSLPTLVLCPSPLSDLQPRPPFPPSTSNLGFSGERPFRQTRSGGKSVVDKNAAVPGIPSPCTLGSRAESRGGTGRDYR